MNFGTGLRLSSAIAGVVCLAVLAIVVPEHFWTMDGVASALVLSISVASPVFLTMAALGSSAAESIRIWLIGPVGKLWLLLLVVSAAALRVSFVGWHRASWAVCVVWCGLCVVGVIILSTSTKIVSGASSQTKIANTDARTRWTQLLVDARQQITSDDGRRLIDRLADKIRFAANESGHEPEENREIDSLLGALKSCLGNPDEIIDRLRSTEVLLDKREQVLRASRTRA